MESIRCTSSVQQLDSAVTSDRTHLRLLDDSTLFYPGRHNEASYPISESPEVKARRAAIVLVAARGIVSRDSFVRWNHVICTPEH